LENFWENLITLDSAGNNLTEIKAVCLGRYANTPINPWSTLTFSQMMIQGQVSKAASLEEADFVLFCDYLEEDVAQVATAKIPIHKRILLILEPEVVLPTNFKKQSLKEFGTVIRVGRPEKLQGHNLNWPQHWREISPTNLKRNQTDAVMISGNKISFVCGELYSLRRNAAFEISHVALYGTGWNSTFSVRFRKLLVEASNVMKSGHFPRIQPVQYWFRNHKNWLGAPGDKTKVLENYRISLVIENSAEFLTEKLFDSFFAGCIPVYVGPNIEDFGIPKSLVVTASGSISSIREGIKRAQDMDYSAWYEELKNWISKEQTKLDWSTESFFRQLTNLILISVSSKR
jgi:hypothetical protein